MPKRRILTLSMHTIDYVHTHGHHFVITSSIKLANNYTTPLNHYTKGHFTHETESPWPLHFKHSHWWRGRSRSKFASSHYTWGTKGVYECKAWIPTWHRMGHVSWSLRLFSKTISSGVALTQNSGTMALRTCRNVDLFCFIICEDLHK